ncbi:sulfate/molybdate ABC transporter ATP-binding protein [Muricoccus pecuniae]|uniref:Sulfate transport system ATP-binding protein n=1 Tax=Muricoccus pecuniae TaxID=693023 RepID=A0A840YGW9_9PROT|nr:ATP-binding cassette domain-containing protein [Roseomonas pecuniae]MBB5695667.1 sulfate transport system ATP-binding protein [Roseomonas pecuniae]
MSGTGVEIRDVARRFGPGAAALDGVSLSVRPGEFVALLGPSGSGKTTLLRILGGLDHADAGSVAIGGRDMAGVPARERGIGFVFQSYALFRHMDVFSNVAFGLRVRRRNRPPAAEIAERVRRLLSLVQIPEMERRYPDQLSGGQRQRVALARALAIEPSLLLLDEPFGALDAQVRKDLRLWLRGLQEEVGITTILVTHDQDEAMEVADRVAVMRAGRIAQFGTPDALLENPADAFVAGFLGEANRLLCTVRAGVAHFEGDALPPLPVQAPEGRALAFIRPHELLARAAPDGPFTLRALRPAGPGTRLVVTGPRGSFDAVAAPDAPLPRRGEPCALEAQAARIFPA